MPDKNLRDAVLAGKVDDGAHRIIAVDDLDNCSTLDGNRNVSIQRFLIAGRQLRLTNVQDVKFTLEPVCVSSAAVDHGRSVRTRRDADEYPLLGSPGFLDSMRMKIIFKLGFDDICR